MRKARVWYQNLDALLWGFALFDLDDKLVLKTQHVDLSEEPYYEVVMAENERIIGVKAKSWQGCAYYFDF